MTNFERTTYNDYKEGIFKFKVKRKTKVNSLSSIRSVFLHVIFPGGIQIGSSQKRTHKKKRKEKKSTFTASVITEWWDYIYSGGFDEEIRLVCYSRDANLRNRKSI